jgi:Holliday junction resolvase RusA-like endonuclease
MSFNINIPMKAFSINQAFYATRKVKTKECRLWETQFEAHLREIPNLRKLSTYKTFHIEIDIIWPENIYYNSRGEISSKTFDVTNTEKLILDCLFTVIGTNDKYVTQLISRKMPGHGYEIRIKILALDRT